MILGRSSKVATALALSAVLAGIPGVARAGGDSFVTQVLKVEQQATGTVLLELKPRDAPVLDSCSSFHVVARYDPSWWPLSRSLPMSKQDHQEAIRHIQGVLKNGAELRFGVIGQGLQPAVEGGPCRYESRGLMLERGTDGSLGVYSVHKWP